MINPSPDVLAREFWAGSGLQDSFPRNIEQAVAIKLPVAIVKLPQLNIRAVGRWLKQRRISTLLPFDQRDLFGCLIAHRGYGIIFVCGSDEPEEQRLTVAHEVAHFLRDYFWPRQQVIRALGEHISDVLDGLQAATPAERAAAILSHIRLGAHVHLLPRPGTDEDLDRIVAYAEDRADRLAFELLAPRECIMSFLQTLSAGETVNPENICAALAAYFGLPAYAFARIVQKMGQRRPVSFLEDAIRTIRGRQ
jgi:Zn-dependent peptidase ImmA (M78 family)